MCMSICSSIKCYIFCSSWHKSVHGENNLSIYRPIHLIMILAATVLANYSPRTPYKSQYKTILADLNWYKAKTLCLVIILTDDAIKYTCIWPLVWHKKYKLYNSSTPLQRSLTFSFTSQRERDAIKDERTHHSAMDWS